MSGRYPYSYAILRYTHDVVAGENVNVGVVLHVPAQRYLRAKTRSTYGRVKNLFPDLEPDAFRESVRTVQRAINKIGKLEAASDLFRLDQSNALLFGQKVLPPSDSSLNWGQVGTGLTDDPESTLRRLFDRFVALYDMHQTGRRTDDDVWKPVRQKLEERHLAGNLHEKSIKGIADEISFKHAWKNGVWHVYEPLSLDLADSDGIKDKARRWLGHLSSVQKGAEPFKPHFFVGAPRNPNLRLAYSSALAILKEAPIQLEVFPESQLEEFVTRIEDEMRHSEPPRSR